MTTILYLLAQAYILFRMTEFLKEADQEPTRDA